MTHEEIKASIGRLRSMRIVNRDFIVDVCRAFLGGEVTGDELHYTLIELLEQADPVNHMELPKDADGEHIHIGDEVCGYNHPNGGVYCQAIVNPCVIAVGDMGDYGNSKGWALWNTLDVRRHHNPTVEDVLVDYYKECQLHASKLGLLGLATSGDDERVWRDLATTFAEKLREVMRDD